MTKYKIVYNSLHYITQKLVRNKFMYQFICLPLLFWNDSNLWYTVFVLFPENLKSCGHGSFIKKQKCNLALIISDR